jgi:hypothetical protein
MQIDESDEQLENARRSMRESFEPGSNVTLQRLQHSLKQASQMTSTEAGMQIDTIEEQSENAALSKRERRESDSKTMTERLRNPSKQPARRV